jgi:hypothetical protein
MGQWVVRMNLCNLKGRQLTPAISQFLARELAHLAPRVEADSDPARLEVTVSAPDSGEAARYAANRAHSALTALELGDWDCQLVDVAVEVRSE